MESGKGHLKFYCLQPVGRLACPASALFDWLVGFPDIRTANAEGCWQSLDGRQAAASMACELTASMSNFTKEKKFSGWQAASKKTFRVDEIGLASWQKHNRDPHRRPGAWCIKEPTHIPPLQLQLTRQTVN